MLKIRGQENFNIPVLTLRKGRTDILHCRLFNVTLFLKSTGVGEKEKPPNKPKEKSWVLYLCTWVFPWNNQREDQRGQKVTKPGMNFSCAGHLTLTLTQRMTQAFCRARRWMIKETLKAKPLKQPGAEPEKLAPSSNRCQATFFSKENEWNLLRLKRLYGITAAWRCELCHVQKHRLGSGKCQIMVKLSLGKISLR